MYEARDRTPEEVEGAPSCRARRPACVLVCDDEARLVRLMVDLLEQFDYRAVAAGGPEAAVAALGEQRIDIALLDVNLRSTGAKEVLSELRAHGFAGPVILTSGSAEEDVSAELRSDPQVASYLAKPFSIERLVEAIDAALDRPPAAS